MKTQRSQEDRLFSGPLKCILFFVHFPPSVVTSAGHRGPLTGQTLSCPVRRQLSGYLPSVGAAASFQDLLWKTLNSRTSAGIRRPRVHGPWTLKATVGESWTFKWKGIFLKYTKQRKECRNPFYKRSEGSSIQAHEPVTKLSPRRLTFI